MKNKILFLIISLLIAPSFALADGCMIPYHQWSDKDIYETSQTALIAYKDGIEDLYLQVNYEGETNDFVWIVPTPTFPKAANAPENIFKELSSLTTPPRITEKDMYWGAPAGNALALSDDAVIVHSQQIIGNYEITVLSAAGVNGLYDWLNNNDYKVNDKNKSILDWYVKNEWYFTAVKIKPGQLLKQATIAFQKFDPIVNENDFIDRFIDYAINSVKTKNYTNFKNFLDVFSLMLTNEYDKKEINQFNQEKFNDLVNDGDFDTYTSEDWSELKEEYGRELKEMLSIKNPDEISKYSEFLKPIKISFSANTIVFPLKISQISTEIPQNNYQSIKTNEVLIYVLTDKQVAAPHFDLEYSDIINNKKLEQTENEIDYSLSGLKTITGNNEFFLTKLRRTFAQEEMDNDLYFINGQTQNEEKLKVYLFQGDGCPHCIELENFIDDIKYIFPEIDFVRYEVYNNKENKKIFDEMAKKVGANSNSVPLTIIQDEYVVGFDTAEITGKNIIKKINNLITTSLSESYQKTPEYLKKISQVKGAAMSDRVKGKILIKVEDSGKAYYVNPTTKYAVFLGRPADAFNVMRNQGIGITNANLERIPIGLSTLSGIDSDKDGLPDIFEDAIKTDKNKADSDKDSYNDKTELENGYSPKGGGKTKIDLRFSDNQKGKILLQIESKGEAWYINPTDGKRYFLGRPTDAFNAMKKLGLGVSNKDFENL